MFFNVGSIKKKKSVKGKLSLVNKKSMIYF